MRRPSTKGNIGTALCSFEPPLLLTLPFALLATASVCARAPLTLTRWVGSLSLLALCIGSIASAVRKTSPAPEDELIAAEGRSEVEMATNRRQIQEIDSLQLGHPLVLSSARGRGQLRVAVTLGAIAVAALVVVTFLMAGQVQRTGPISAFSFVLSLLLIGPPAAIALHLALTRVSVELTSQRVRVFERRGLLLSTRSEWQSSEIESLRLVGSELGSLASVVIEGRTGRTCVPLCGLAFDEARAALGRAGCRSVDIP